MRAWPYTRKRLNTHTENVLELQHFEDLPLGGEWTTRRRTVTEADVAAFVGLSGDFNPLYADLEHARSSQFGGPVAPGGLIAVMTAGLGSMDVPIPATVGLVGMSWKFLAPVQPGDTLGSRWRLSRKRNVENPNWGLAVWQIEVENQRGELVASGEMTRLIAKREQVVERTSRSRRRRRKSAPAGQEAADVVLSEPVPEPAPADLPAPAARRRRRRGSAPEPAPEIAAEQQSREPEAATSPAPVSEAPPARRRRRRRSSNGSGGGNDNGREGGRDSDSTAGVENPPTPAREEPAAAPGTAQPERSTEFRWERAEPPEPAPAQTGWRAPEAPRRESDDGGESREGAATEPATEPARERSELSPFRGPDDSERADGGGGGAAPEEPGGLGRVFRRLRRP